MESNHEKSILTLLNDFSIIKDIITVVTTENIKSLISDYECILRSEGIGRGSIVALSISDSFTLSMFIMTTLEMGCTDVLFYHDLKPAEYDQLLDYYPVQFILSDNDVFDMQWSSVRKVGGNVKLFKPGADLSIWEKVNTKKLESSVVLLTSGSTTKVPKAVIKPLSNIIADGRAILEALEMKPGQRILCAAPIDHAYGLGFGLLAPLIASSSVLYVSPSILPSQLVKKINNFNIDILIGLPLHYKMLAESRSDTLVLNHLKIALSATAPIGRDTLLKFQEKYNFTIWSVYGSSEAGVMTIQQDRVSKEEPISIGVPFPGVRLELISNEDLPHNCYELAVISGALAIGYFENGTYIDLKKENCWKTGDVITSEDDKYYLSGRLNTFINVNGKKVNPLEIEEVLMRHPAVKEAVVIGEKSDKRIEVPHAFLTVSRVIEDIILINYCKEFLADYKIPSSFTYLDELPRGSTGKIMRNRLLKNINGGESL
ncbi:class I adenylate-forming enzyme family protein [Paenibacillus xylanexedens]|uniref:class I adenylate-forming enzyme family protein n=1 Tax=Paenibacillus xylanexedens TaxID=528191 RepID=UPI003D08EA13